MNNTNAFSNYGLQTPNYHDTMLSLEPQMQYQAALQPVPGGPSPFWGTAPMQQRASKFYRGMFDDMYRQYEGYYGKQMADRTDPGTVLDPDEWMRDEIKRNPFSERYARMTPYQRGTSVSKFAPSTRHIYYS